MHQKKRCIYIIRGQNPTCDMGYKAQTCDMGYKAQQKSYV